MKNKAINSQLNHSHNKNNYDKILKIPIRNQHVNIKNNTNAFNIYNNSTKFNNERYELKPKITNEFHKSKFQKTVNQLVHNVSIERNNEYKVTQPYQDSWFKIMNRTSGENSLLNNQFKISKSKTFRSQIFPNKGLNENLNKRLLK